jgi:hypothetical protein
MQRLALGLFLRRTRAVFARLGRRVARQIADYVDAGVDVVGIVGIDGSPSCGVRTTIDLRRSLPLFAALDAERMTREDVNACVRSSIGSGTGLFIAALKTSLVRRGISVPFVAHDLLAEMRGHLRPDEILAALSAPKETRDRRDDRIDPPSRA